MKILISNDDGIQADGIHELAKRLTAFGDIYIVAPDREQSAIGHAITMHQPLRCKKIDFHKLDVHAWWVTGTPADCIKLGIESLLPFRPDLVISGINNGENLGTDVIYSGTVSAAIEGAIFGIPSIAISYARHGNPDFSLPAQAAEHILKPLLESGRFDKTLLNINIPPIEKLGDIKGAKVTQLGVKKYRNNFEERKDPRGNSYYWLAGELIEEEIDPDSDIAAIKAGYVSVTPIHFDLTDYSRIEKIKQLNLSVQEGIK